MFQDIYDLMVIVPYNKVGQTFKYFPPLIQVYRKEK